MDKERILQIFVPLILCVVASIQIYFVHHKDLTPWKGGGFGMFASIDRMERRPIQIIAKSSDKIFAIDFLHQIKDRQKRRDLQSLPSMERLNELTNFIAERNWIPDTTAKIHPENNSFAISDNVYKNMLKPIDDHKELSINEQNVKIENIEINVYRMVFDKKTDKLSLKLLKSSVVEF